MRVRAAVLEAIVAHARAEAPRECCGLLIGRDDSIEESRPATNLLGSAVAFRIDPADHFAALRAARRTGRQVVGAYHSHPRSPAAPSPRDIEESNDPDLVHLIVSLVSDPPAAAYRIRDGIVHRLPFTIESW